MKENLASITQLTLTCLEDKNRNNRKRYEISFQRKHQDDIIHCCRSGVFIVNFEYISHLFFVCIVNFEQVNVSWVLFLYKVHLAGYVTI